MVVGCGLLDFSDMLRWVFLEFAGAVIAAEGHCVGFLWINSFATQRALVVHRLSGDFHLLDEVVGVLLELTFAVIAAEADEVALVVGRGLDGIAAEWARVVYRSGLDFGDGGTRIFGELALTVAAAEPYRIGGVLFYSVTAERAFFVDWAGDNTDQGD